jgi:putative transposase
MSQTQSPHLTPAQLQALDDLILTSPSPATRRRAEAIRLLAEGHTPRTAAQAIGVMPKTVRAWCRRFRADGIDGFADRPRSGRPTKADPNYIDWLESALAETPEDMGFDGVAGWTVPMLRTLLERETRINLSDGRLRVLLHRLGYRFEKGPSLLQLMLPPFPSDYAGMRAWLEQETMLREQLPEHQTKAVKTWVKVEDDANS